METRGGGTPSASGAQVVSGQWKRGRRVPQCPSSSACSPLDRPSSSWGWNEAFLISDRQRRQNIEEIRDAPGGDHRIQTLLQCLNVLLEFSAGELNQPVSISPACSSDWGGSTLPAFLSFKSMNPTWESRRLRKTFTVFMASSTFYNLHQSLTPYLFGYFHPDTQPAEELSIKPDTKSITNNSWNEMFTHLLKLRRVGMRTRKSHFTPALETGSMSPWH